MNDCDLHIDFSGTFVPFRNAGQDCRCVEALALFDACAPGRYRRALLRQQVRQFQLKMRDLLDFPHPIIRLFTS
jgi:hypothetical protein